MGTTAWVDSATREWTPGPVSSTDLSAQHHLAQPTGTPEAEALERDRATRFVRRQAGQEAEEFLQALGLTPYVYADTGAEELPCARCKRTKPRTDFSPNRRRRTGRAATCRACCAAAGDQPTG